MSGTVFESYIKSVYGSGSSMEYFDSIDGGSLDIFGGLGPTEIFDEPVAYSGANDHEAIDTFVGGAEPDNDEPSRAYESKKERDLEDSSDNSSTIGYLQYDGHKTYIEGHRTTKGGYDEYDLTAPIDISLGGSHTEISSKYIVDGGSCNEYDLTAPIDIRLGSNHTEISPEDISDALFRLDN